MSGGEMLANAGRCVPAFAHVELPPMTDRETKAV